MIAIPMQVSASNVSLPVGVSTNGTVQAGISVSYQMIAGQYYEGGYEFTPSNEVQIIHTANKVVSQDITVHPIPQNYGLITYNGAYITVS